MNPERDEVIDRILEEQAELKRRLAALESEIAALRTIPSKRSQVLEASTSPKPQATPPPLPPSLHEAEAAEAARRAAAVAATETAIQSISDPAAEAARPDATPPTPKATDESGGFEFKLGTFWLVRIGILMLLTGFVFLANHLANHFLTSKEIAPGLKVGALYLLSFGLLGAGTWIEKTRENLQNFGQVLGAGGLAAVYFTTFAAHKFPALAVISNNIVAVVLLFLWAGFMVFLADRKQSQTLAIMGVLLAYYTLLIDEVSMFSLWSALILSGVALIFLVRNRWTAVGSLSLAGTYLAFAYWRFPELLSWLNNATANPDTFWPEYGFLICYWAVFTATVFLSSYLTEKQRAALAGLNNSAFLVFFGLGMGRHYPDSFWVFSLLAGIVFVGLSLLANRHLGRSNALGTLYLAKGLLLITLAFFIKLSGLSLAILLAAEAAALLVIATLRRSRVLEVGAYVSAILALAYTAFSEVAGPDTLWFVEFTEGIPALAAFAQLLFFMISAWWVRNRSEQAPSGPELRFELQAWLFLSLGIAAFLIGAYTDVSESLRAPIFLGAGVAGAAIGSLRRVRLPELSILAQVFSAVGIITFVLNEASLPLLHCGFVLTTILGLLHWSCSSRSPVAALDVRPAFEWSFSAAWSLVLILTIERIWEPNAAWLYLPGILALAQLAYGFRMRLPALAILSQAFHPIVLFEYSKSILPVTFACYRFAHSNLFEYSKSDSWILGLLPLVLIFINLSAVAFLRARAREDFFSAKSLHLLGIGIFLLRFLALFFYFSFVFEHVDPPWRPLAFAVAALGAHLVSIVFLDRQRLFVALLLLGTTLMMLVIHAIYGDSAVHWQYYLAALAPFAMQQLARRRGGSAGESRGLHWSLAIAAVVVPWLAISVDVANLGEGYYLTASWSLLGLVVFAIGWFLRERPYRLLSLAVLGAALARLLAIEVWNLEPVARIITFILIGMILLGLGFAYSRNQDKLKEIF